MSTNLSSDEDIPLEILKNHCLRDKFEDVSPISTVGDISDTDIKLVNMTLKQRFFDLLNQYERLKDRHVALGQEIDVLEKVNIDLKCRLFKF